MKELLNNFNQIKIESPVDKIINQIKELISSGQLKSGDRLPSERLLSERFGIGRSYVRDAIRKLEFFGILKTLPQSGTVVAGFGITALEGLIADMLQLEGNDFHALVETRVLLEMNSAKFAASRRNDDDIVALTQALDEYEKVVQSGNDSVECDLMFHLKIAEASKNSVLNTLMLIITPDILTFFKENNVCGGDRPVSALKEHKIILDHIINQDAEQASDAMKAHLSDVLEYSINQNNLINNNDR